MVVVRSILLSLSLSCWTLSQAWAQGIFPVSVQHALGTTVIESAPERIVTLGWSSEDTVLSLGTIPIAMPRYRFFPSGILPWNEERLGGVEPQLLDGELNYEAIAALRPDVILAVYSGIDALVYQRLSAIAPTVAYRSGPWASDWREQTTLIGEALGKEDEAKGLLARTDAFLESLGTRTPVLDTKSFVFGTYFPGENSVVVYLPPDPRVRALMGLGLRPSTGVQALSDRSPGETSVSIGLEEIAAIDADILVMWYGEGARASAEAQPLFQTLGAVKRGAYVALEDPVEVWSTSALSVLSIPYGFPRFIPRLAEAASRAEAR